MTEHTKTPARQEVDALGLASVAAALNMPQKSVRVIVSDTRNKGLLPSPWYGPLSALAAELGHSLNMSAFRWRDTDGAA